MTKAELHRLVDALPDGLLPAAAILLRCAQDPVAAKLDAAPNDDEELTDEDLRAVKEAERIGRLLVRRRGGAERRLIRGQGESPSVFVSEGSYNLDVQTSY